MTGPARLLVAELRREPASLAGLAERLQYPVARVLSFIVEARAAGFSIRAVEDGVTRSVPPRAAPESGILTSVFALESSSSTTVDDRAVTEGQSA